MLILTVVYTGNVLPVFENKGGGDSTMNKITTLKQRGFTLIELMIVVAIIGILAAVAIPKFADMLRKSKEGATKGSLTNLRSALTIYISDNEGTNPMQYDITPTASELISSLTPRYMEAIPTAKLGTYHSDAATIKISALTDRSADVTTVVTSTPLADANGWTYMTSSGGGWWVNCQHSDTKSVFITNW